MSSGEEMKQWREKRLVKKWGNSCGIQIPSKFMGCDATITIHYNDVEVESNREYWKKQRGNK